MADFKSRTVQIDAPNDAVFAKLSDLENVRPLLPIAKSKEIEVKELSSDRCTLNASMVGEVSLEIVQRTPHSLIQMEGKTALVTALAMQLRLGNEEGGTKTSLSAHLTADVPFFAQMMVDKPIREGLDKVVDLLSRLNYV